MLSFLKSLLYAFLFGAVIALLLNITGYNWLMLKMTAWYYGVGLVNQILLLGGFSLLAWGPVLIWTNKKTKAYNKWGTDSETGEPIKSISEILKQSDTTPSN